MLSPSLEVRASSELLSRLADSRRTTDALFDIVRTDSLYDRPIPERHRIVFYIGHLEAFDRNLLAGNLLPSRTVDSDFDKLFAFGIDPVGGGLPTDQPSDWPALDHVRHYVRRVRDELDDGLASLNWPDEGGRAFSSTLLLNVAIEHRLMHAETLAYMLHQLPADRKIGPANKPRVDSVRGVPSVVEIPSGAATLGLTRSDDTFGWDNEYEQNEISVPPFGIDRYKVTNREFMEFMASGGYGNRDLWNDADWDWKELQHISHPAFWLRQDGEWFWRGMFDEVPLPSDWPVYVSHAEASAYARWAGKSLPTEAQWQRAAYGSLQGDYRAFPWGSEQATAAQGNFDFERWDPVSVFAHNKGESGFGLQDTLGNGWEWTSTVFAAFPGFRPFPFYRGYSADFFDGKHFVIKGASARTAACMLRPSFRNWFQPHYQYVYAGFRCVSNRLA